MSQIGEKTNIIKVSFLGDRRKQENNHDDDWLEESWDEDGLDFDPLNDLLTEFDDISPEEMIQTSDYIHHLTMVEDKPLSLEQSTLEMSEDINKKVSRINESFKRLKYYLDEMNLEE
ncbi:MAG: hypothetical protein CME62_04505 [Halobacteriovoraceae bacterium]|nr:hypothetical protein [Halobacteriovoraceae bacterium]|tara:strand:- start:23133 stop:23483 length:351 start_codon:yes stop_codon:yes gene_type:complete